MPALGPGKGLEPRVGRRYVTETIIVYLSTPNCFWLHLIIWHRRGHNAIVIVVMEKSSPPPQEWRRRSCLFVRFPTLRWSTRRFSGVFIQLEICCTIKRASRDSPPRPVDPPPSHCSPGYCVPSEAVDSEPGYLFVRRPLCCLLVSGLLFSFCSLFQFGGMKNFIGIGFYCGGPFWWISFFGRYKLCDANGACGRARVFDFRAKEVGHRTATWLISREIKVVSITLNYWNTINSLQSVCCVRQDNLERSLLRKEP